MNTARTWHRATLLYDGTVLIAGGYNGSYLSSAELYNPVAGTFAFTGSLNTALVQDTATLLNNGSVLIAGGYTGSVVLSSAELYSGPAPGWINPKYKIIGVMYAPPGSQSGPQSSATYAQDTVVGSSTSMSTSFSNQLKQTVSVTSGFSIFGFSTKETSTTSTSYTQEQDSSNSVAVSQTTSSLNGISGFYDPVHGLNHDYDQIYLWLNPILTFALWPGTNPPEVTWTGYGFDLNDPNRPDIDKFIIPLGCLNGDFYTNNFNSNWQTCLSYFQTNLQRSWALPNIDGSSPALTPLAGPSNPLANLSPPYNFCQQEGTDLYQICQADPFANPSYGQQEFPLAPGIYTSADGRFTACNNTGCNATIDFTPYSFQNYSQGYSTTVTQSEGGKYTYQTSYSIESQFGYSQSGCAASSFCATFQGDVNDSTTYTWIDQFSQSTNSSQGQTSSFVIYGPPEGYTEPDQFVTYQDNLYGTFMFNAQ